MNTGPIAAAILVVCDGNVCRSPLIAFMVAQSWPMTAASAGMRAEPGAPLCPLVSERVAVLGGGRKYADDFRSRNVLSVDVAAHELILTATKEIRSALVLQHPAQRERIFTVLEALALSRTALDREEVSLLKAKGTAPVLLARRGMMAPSPPRSAARLWGNRNVPLDISDGHVDRRNRHHLATVDACAKAGADLGVQLWDWHRAA